MTPREESRRSRPDENPWAGNPALCAYTSPVPAYQPSSVSIYILILILSYIDDLGDLVNVSRTSRLFYYAALPRLYESVTLRLYKNLRYREDNLPEGYGGGSPFSTALNAMATRNLAQYVRSFHLTGQINEPRLEDYSKGRVPDNSFILNIAIRAAMDKMKNLETFIWDLRGKPLQTIYQGLSSCTNLQTLTLRFPDSRLPSPIVTVPPFPNLREFKALEIDPLCSPDDISVMIAHSPKLEGLHLQWSARMRNAGEESINLALYFGRCIANKRPLKLKRLSTINLFARATNVDFNQLVDLEDLEETTFLNSRTCDANSVFVDDTWRFFTLEKPPRGLRMMRTDAVDDHPPAGLDRLYFVSNGAGPSPARGRDPTPPSSPNCPAALLSRLGPSLRHLLLPDHWLLDVETVGRLARACPRLEQLGVAVGDVAGCLRVLGTRLPEMWALRFLRYTLKSEFEESWEDNEDIDTFLRMDDGWNNLRWLGMGDVVFRCRMSGHGGLMKSQVETERDVKSIRRILEKVNVAAVRDVEIWKMDNGEIV